MRLRGRGGRGGHCIGSWGRGRSRLLLRLFIIQPRLYDLERQGRQQQQQQQQPSSDHVGQRPLSNAAAEVHDGCIITTATTAAAAAAVDCEEGCGDDWRQSARHLAEALRDAYEGADVVLRY